MATTDLHIYSALKPSNPLLFPPKHPFGLPEFRVFKRRKLKSIPSSHLSPLNHLLPPFSNLLDSLLLPQSLAFASFSVAAVLLSMSAYNNGSKNKNKKRRRIGHSLSSSSDSDDLQWILFSSPTPFNRFVFLRCPSVSFTDGDEKLITEDRHFIRVNSGTIRSWGQVDEEEEDDKSLEYQRVCVRTEDGGVVSIDWPESLDMSEERGLDTTVVVVPGTAEGSMDGVVRGFVREALRRGLFPVVINPRGCAGSPITTAR